jgi:type II secretory pathway component PulF
MAGLGLRPVTLSEKAGQAKKSSGIPVSLGSFPFLKKVHKVSARALEDFTRLLSSLLAAGVPLSRALVILHKESSNPAAQAKWKEIHNYVVDGMSLADAMGKSPDTFPRVYTAMVQAGETGGFLDLVLAQIADFQAREKDLRAKVMAAMLYPSVLMFLALAVLVFLLTFFIPNSRSSSKGSVPPCLCPRRLFWRPARCCAPTDFSS